MIMSHKQNTSDHKNHMNQNPMNQNPTLQTIQTWIFLKTSKI